MQTSRGRPLCLSLLVLITGMLCAMLGFTLQGIAQAQPALTAQESATERTDTLPVVAAAEITPSEPPASAPIPVVAVQPTANVTPTVTEVTVQAGQGISQAVGAGQNWRAWADHNNIRGPRYVVYPGQKLYAPSVPLPAGQAHTPPARKSTDDGKKDNKQDEPPPAPAASSAADKAVAWAMSQRGKPYVWGGTGPNSFDCSGLTSQAYKHAGVNIPRSSKAQSGVGKPVAKSDLRPGDLVFFYSPVSHVAMYIGDGKIVQAQTSGQPVKVTSLNQGGPFNSARRVA